MLENLFVPQVTLKFMFVKIELSYPKYELIVYFYETKNVLTVNPVQTKLVLQVANG
jgi:hypothetical protein